MRWITGRFTMRVLLRIGLTIFMPHLPIQRLTVSYAHAVGGVRRSYCLTSTRRLFAQILKYLSATATTLRCTAGFAMRPTSPRFTVQWWRLIFRVTEAWRLPLGIMA